MTIGFWLVAASGCGVLGAFVGLRLCAARRTWLLLDWWWAFAGVALIGAVASGLAEIRKLEEQTFAVSQVSTAQRSLYADVLRTEQSECGESLIQHGGAVPQLCLSVERVGREVLSPRMPGVDAIALAGELDDACPDRCDKNTVALRDDLKHYASTVNEMAPLMADITSSDIVGRARFANASIVALCLSLGMLCLRLALAWRRTGNSRNHVGGDEPSTSVRVDEKRMPCASIFPAATGES